MLYHLERCESSASRRFGGIAIVSRITSISLDEETAMISKQIPNFSGFVRDCLRRYWAEVTETVCLTLDEHKIGGLCRMRKERVCLECWPNGYPSKDDWKIFMHASKSPEREHVGMRSYDHPRESLALMIEARKDPQEWIQSRARFHNVAFDLTGVKIKGNAKPAQKPKKLTAFQRILLGFRA